MISIVSEIELEILYEFKLIFLLNKQSLKFNNDINYFINENKKINIVI